MRVSKETAEQLKRVRGILEEEVRRGGGENDAKGVYDRIISRLVTDASLGEDIAIARGYEGRVPPYDKPSLVYHNKQRFTALKVIEEIALNEFARYVFYEALNGFMKSYHDLTRRVCPEQEGDLDISKENNLLFLKEQLRVFARDKGWYSALDKVAERVSHHWGTPLEAVE